VFLFLFGLTTVVGIVVGLAPALIAVREDARGAIQASDMRTTMTAAQRRLRDLLAIAEVALALCLAIGAALLVRELLRLRATDLGMQTHDVLTLHLGRRFPASTPDAVDANVRRFYDIADRVTALPGVRAAGLTQLLPLQSWGWFSNSIDFFEKGRSPRQPVFPIELRFVTPGYFQALGIPLLRGRGFTAADTRQTPMVIVINQTLARLQFGNEDPIGRQMNRGTIVGVIADVRGVHPDQPPRPEIYHAAAQNWSQVSDQGMTLVVSTGGPPDAIVERVRSVVREVDPAFAVFEVKTMDGVLSDSLALFRLFLALIGGFAAIAVLLALTGTYGVMSFIANSRSREFAVRMALGADRRQVAAAVLGQGARLAAVGLSAGLGLTFAALPLLRNLPITVRPPTVLVVAPLLAALTAATVAASLLPALRASRLDPMSVLRND